MSKKKTTEEFIEEIKKIHGNKYDYSKINYVNNKTKVCIICPKHGEFWQRPDKIINRHDGCEKCSYEYRSSIFRKKQDDFIKDAVKIHGQKDDYSKTFSHKSSDKICRICPKHGEFWQIANDHIRGSGCPVCKQSNLEKEISMLKKLLMSNEKLGSEIGSFQNQQDWMNTQGDIYNEESPFKKIMIPDEFNMLNKINFR